MGEDNFVLQAFIGQLTAARKSRGFSQKDLASKLGAAQSYVARIEKGQTDLRASNLIQIARLLGLELMLIPIELVPAVTGIVLSKNRQATNLEDEPLYELSGEADEEDE